MSELGTRNIDAIAQRLQLLGRPDGAMQAPENSVLITRDTAVATVTINRPQVRNALDTATWRGLAAAFEELGRDEKIRAVALEGAGSHFSAGADVKEFARMAKGLEGRSEEVRGAARDYFTVARATLTVMDKSPFVTIAKMRGFALGIGTILVLACDRRVADDTVKTGIPAGVIGVMLDPRELRRLSSHIGESNAKTMIFSKEVYDAQASRRLTLIDDPVKPEELDDAVLKAASEAAEQSRGAIITAKAGFRLLAEDPGFEDDDINLADHYQWADEAVERIRARFER